MAEIKRRSALKIWGDVIFALFIREIRSKFSDRLGIGWAIFEPLAFIMAFSYGRSLISGSSESHTMPMFVFMMYGMLLVQLFLGPLASSAAAIKLNKPLYAFRQVQPISAVISSSLIEALFKLAVWALLHLAIYFFSIESRLDDLMSLIWIVISLLLLASSIGLLFGIAEMYIEELKKVRALITRPIFIISGVFFSLQDIPPQYWKYLDWNPILHAVELARQASYQSFQAQGVSLEYLSLCSLVALFSSLVCYSAFWKGAISR